MRFSRTLLAGVVSALLMAPAFAAPALAYDDNPAHIDWGQVEKDTCLVTKTEWGFKVCIKGDKQGYWNVGFIGDSHMRQYFGPLDILAKRYHWRVSYISKSACTVGDWQTAPIGKRRPSCGSWNRHLQAYFRHNPPFDLVVNSNSSFVSHASKRQAVAFATVVKPQVERGTNWMIISDNPKPAKKFQACIDANGANAQTVCVVPYAQAMVPADILPSYIAGFPNVTIADFHAQICPNDICPAVLNGVRVYRDFSHLDGMFTRTLLPQVDAAIPDRFKHKPAGAHSTAAPSVTP